MIEMNERAGARPHTAFLRNMRMLRFMRGLLILG